MDKDDMGIAFMVIGLIILSNCGSVVLFFWFIGGIFIILGIIGGIVGLILFIWGISIYAEAGEEKKHFAQQYQVPGYPPYRPPPGVQPPFRP